MLSRESRLCKCGAAATKVCPRCYSSYYCGVACQTSDWPTHRGWCSRIANTVRANPWYIEISPQEPKFVSPMMVEMSWIFAHGIGAAIDKYRANINTVREPTGQSLLHIAVTLGDLGAVEQLLRAGAYVNSCDWRRNTPIYYACSHPGLSSAGEKCDGAPDIAGVESAGTVGTGTEGVVSTVGAVAEGVQGDDSSVTPLSKNRAAIVRALIRAGADTMGQGGYSGKRPFEIAEDSGYPEIAELIASSPEHARLCKVRALINSDIGEGADPSRQVVKQFTDCYWRGETCHWLIQPNRHIMGICFRPHGELVGARTLEEIEALFQDVVVRSRSMN